MTTKVPASALQSIPAAWFDLWVPYYQAKVKSTAPPQDLSGVIFYALNNLKGMFSFLFCIFFFYYWRGLGECFANLTGVSSTIPMYAKQHTCTRLSAIPAFEWKGGGLSLIFVNKSTQSRRILFSPCFLKYYWTTYPPKINKSVLSLLHRNAIQTTLSIQTTSNKTCELHLFQL